MLTVILLSLLVIVYIIVEVRSRINEAYAQILPPLHPGSLPIIGHTHYLISDTKFAWFLAQKVAENCRKMGGIIYGKFGPDIYYLITDPEDALTVSNTCLKKHFLYRFAKDWLGQGLITADGDVYHRHRRMLNPSFTVACIHGYLDIFNSQARKLVKEMDTYSERGPFDLCPPVKNIVLETSCLTTFGTDIKNKNFFNDYMIALDGIMNLIIQRFQKFYLHKDFCYKLFGPHKKWNLFIKTLNTLSTEVIQQRRAAINYENVKNEKSNFVMYKEVQFKPFLDRLIELSTDGLLTDQEIREEADTNIAASFETTAYTLIHLMVILGTYPNVQEKMCKEFIEVLGTKRDVGKDDLQKLTYTKAVIKESLRIIPTVPVILRTIDKEVELKNYTLRSNTYCVILNIGMHRNPAWGPDADQFKPERWLDPASLPTNANYFAAFSFGKRACVGMTYSMTFLTVLLAHVVRKYKWTGDITKLELKLDVTLRPESGQEISIQRRM